MGRRPAALVVTAVEDERREGTGENADRRSVPTSGRDDRPSSSRRAVLEGAAAASVIGTGLLGIVGSGAAQGERDVDEGATASVSMRDQPSDGNIVVVDSARLPDGGYVGVHSEHLLHGDDETSMIGVSDYRDAGEHEAIAIDLLELEGIEFEVGQLYEDQRLFAVPHRETTGNEVNEFAATAGEVDRPYKRADAPVVDSGYVTVDEDRHVATVSFRNQRADGATVTVDSVTLTDGGFVVLHDATTVQDDLAASVVGTSDYLGYGIHDDVAVRLTADTDVDASTGSGLALAAVPHVDSNGNEAFDFVESAGDVDGPYVEDGRPVAAFGFVVPE